MHSSTFKTLLFLGLSLLASIATPTLSAAISGSDDFNDNFRDTDKWGTGSDRSAGSGTLTETSGHLEYRSTRTSSTENSYRPWRLNNATYDTNWEVIINVTNNATPTLANASASVGFEIFAPSGFTKSLYADLTASTFAGVPVQRGFESALLDADNEFGDTIKVTGTTVGAIRMTFDAGTKVINFYTDANGPTGGYQWALQGSYGIGGSGGTTANTNWGMSGSAAFQIYIFGYSQDFAVGSGLVYADDFSASSGTSATTSVPTHFADGSATLHGTLFPNGLETSVIFQCSTDANFAEAESTEPQIIPAAASTTPISDTISSLAPGTAYWVRTVATNSAGTFYGNVIMFHTPPFTLTVNPTTGSVNPPPSTGYQAGTVVTLTATPPAGSAFLGWSGAVTGTTNPITVVMDDNKSITANFSVPLADALDASGLTFTSSSAVPWFGQSTETHDGVDAAQSGVIPDAGFTTFETTVNGPGEISFWWKVSSEGSSDFLQFFIDELFPRDAISGLTGWTKRTFTVEGAGPHTLRWGYRKDFSNAVGLDAGWVDQIVWTPQAMNFDTWKSTKFTTAELADPAISGANADPDHDGIGNLLEFALGGSPKEPATGILPISAIETSGADRYLTLSVAKPGGITGVTYTVKVSSDLATWFSDTAHTTVITDSTSALKVRDNTPLGSNGARFIRLEVSTL